MRRRRGPIPPNISPPFIRTTGDDRARAMKRVRLTLRPDGDFAPPLYRRLTGGASYLTGAQIINWNVAAPPTAFLLWLRGDYGRFEAELAASENVDAYEVLPISDRECHCFFQGQVADAARSLFEIFTRGSLITIPPIECNDDGSNTFAIVGTEADIQRAVDAVPDPVDVTIDAVGGESVAPKSAVGRLSPRQREAVEIALELGYYAVPRDATAEDVAGQLDCAAATAAEHLKKAESAIIEALFEE